MLKKNERDSSKFISESQKLFNKVFTHQLKHFRTKADTIFENMDYISENEMYLKFIDSKYYDIVIHENSAYNKMNIIKGYLFEEFGNIYYAVKDGLMAKGDGQVSFSHDYLLENTLIQFPEIARSGMTAELFNESLQVLSTDARYQELFEAGLAYGAAAAAGTVALGGTPLLAAGIGMSTSIALELFMPTKWSMAIDNHVMGFVTFLTRTLLGTKTVISNFGPSLNASQHSLESFDNINMNKDLIKLFASLGSRHTFNNGDGAQSLNVIVSKCVDANKELFDQENFITRAVPGNIYRNILNSIFINNGNRSNSNGIVYDKLLRYRKCVIASLSDVYKFTMITNLKDVKNYDQILKTMNQGYSGRPEQLLNFIDVRNDHASIIKENLLDLIKLRIIINEMIKNFDNGAFQVDKEAGQFMEQKFKQIDSEIAAYLKHNANGLEVFDKKEYNGIPAKSVSVFNNRYRPIKNNQNSNETTVQDNPRDETSAVGAAVGAAGGDRDNTINGDAVGVDKPSRLSL